MSSTSTSPSTSSSSTNYGSDIDIDIDIDVELLDSTHDSSSTAAASSDYGSDIDLTDIDLLNLLDDPAHLYPPLPLLEDDLPPRRTDAPLVAIQYEDLATSPHQPPILPTVSPSQPEADAADAADTVPALLGRSPYERFRSRRGRLSVTDLVSGVWCEQQFMYSLETGFRRRTPAMARGTKLHKVLEEEVHTAVPVTPVTREDRFGLKLFNMCQRLESLAEYGMMREFEVFGWLKGIFISGIIDEIKYGNPRKDGAETQAEVDAEAETEVATQASSGDDESFTTCPDGVQRIAYITDTKTRMTPTVPKQSQQLSASLQLGFYHTLLASLPSVPFADVLIYHNLSPTARLSDGFIAQIASLQNTVSLTDLLENNSLPGMWSLVLSQYTKAIDSVGDTVGVTYRYQGSGDVIAERSWRVEDDTRELHLEDVMQWWKGKRAARGVPIEEAWKCGMCEFQNGCSWRQAKLEETRRKARGERIMEVDPKEKVEIEEAEVNMVKKFKKGRKVAEREANMEGEHVAGVEREPRRRRSKKKKKEGEEQEDAASTDDSVKEVAPKRGRGRPKKVKAAATNAAVNEEVKTVKRGRRKREET